MVQCCDFVPTISMGRERDSYSKVDRYGSKENGSCLALSKQQQWEEGKYLCVNCQVLQVHLHRWVSHISIKVSAYSFVNNNFTAETWIHVKKLDCGCWLTIQCKKALYDDANELLLCFFFTSRRAASRERTDGSLLIACSKSRPMGELKNTYALPTAEYWNCTL